MRNNSLKLRQREIVLALLQRKPWVTLTDLLDLRIANYRARVSDLRDEGWIIFQDFYVRDGKRLSRYQLRGKLSDQPKGQMSLLPEVPCATT